MYDPTIGRWLEQDPIGFDAGDMNLYRMEGNNPTNEVDPSGLADERPTGIGDLPTKKERENLERNLPYFIKQFGHFIHDLKEDGKVVIGGKQPVGVYNTVVGSTLSQLSSDDYEIWFEQGCIGLASLRTGSYKFSRHPQRHPDVHVFWNLQDAKDYQAKLKGEIGDSEKPFKSVVLFAIESKNDISSFAKPLKENNKMVDPKTLTEDKLEPYDFATAFQDRHGEIQFWERMPYGISDNPNLNVNYTKGHVYESVVYGVVVTDSPYRPCVVLTIKSDNSISFK